VSYCYFLSYSYLASDSISWFFLSYYF
jgi:hypothetical protein